MGSAAQALAKYKQMNKARNKEVPVVETPDEVINQGEVNPQNDAPPLSKAAQALARFKAEAEPEVIVDTAPTGIEGQMTADVPGYGYLDTSTPKPDESFNPLIVSEGVKEGFADFAAVPGYLVDGVNWMVDQLPGVDMANDPVGGSKQIRDGWLLLLTHQKQQPKNKLEEYTGKVAEFAGGSIVMGASMVNRMLAANQTINQVTKAVSMEAVSTVSGGVVAQGYGDFFAEAYGEEYRYLGEIAGGIGGTTLPGVLKSLVQKAGLAYGPLKKVLMARDMESVSDLVDEFIPDAALKSSRKKIAAAIGDNPSSSRNIDEAMALEQQIEGFKPSMAQASDAPGMKAMQDQINARSVENINQAMKTEMANGEAIYAYYRKNFPEQIDQPFDAKRQFKQTRMKLRQEQAKIESQYKVEAKTYPRTDSEKVGSRLQVLAKAKMKLVKKVKNKNYDDLYDVADELGVVEDITDIRRMVGDINKQDQTFFDTVPGVYAKIKSLLKTGKEATATPADNVASFRKIHSLYREVSREYGRALRADDGVKLFHLDNLKQNLDNKLAGFEDPAYGNFANRKKAVDLFYKEEYLNVFKKGIGAKISGVRGRESTPEGKIISDLVLTKGSSRGLDQYRKLYGDSPESNVLLQEGILDTFSQKTVKQGTLSQSSIDNFMGDYKEVLAKTPSLQRRFADTATLLDDMARRNQVLKKREKIFTNAAASRYAKLAGMDDLDSAVGMGLTDKPTMRLLMRSMKTQEAKAGLATNVADHVMDQPNPWTFLKDNENTLKPLFNQLKPGHYNNLKTVADAMEILNRHKTNLRVNPMNGAVDALHAKIGTSIPSAFAQVRWAALYGKTSMEYVVADIGSKYLFKLRNDNTERLIEEALYDSDLAQLLSDIATQPAAKPSPKIVKKLGQKAIEIGIRLGERTIRSGAIAYDSDEKEQQALTP